MTEPMFIGPSTCPHAMIAVCSLLWSVLLGVAVLVKQHLEFRKLDRRWDKIMGRSK